MNQEYIEKVFSGWIGDEESVKDEIQKELARMQEVGDLE